MAPQIEVLVRKNVLEPELVIPLAEILCDVAADLFGAVAEHLQLRQRARVPGDVLGLPRGSHPSRRSIGPRDPTRLVLQA